MWFQFDPDNVAVETKDSLTSLVLAPFSIIKEYLTWLSTSSANSGGFRITDRIGGEAVIFRGVAFASYDHLILLCYVITVRQFIIDISKCQIQSEGCLMSIYETPK